MGFVSGFRRARRMACRKGVDGLKPLSPKPSTQSPKALKTGMLFGVQVGPGQRCILGR